MNKFLEFYNTRKGKIIIFSILGIGVLALIVGLIIGAVTTASEGASELNNLSIAEIRGRISSEYIIPEFENYHANGKLVFSKKLSYEDMKKSDNNKYIVKYEITYVNNEGSGFILTSSCNPDVKFEVSKLELSDEYKEPIYLSLDEESHKYPLYIQIKNISEQNEKSVSLCFDKDGQIFSVTTRINDASKIDSAIDTLKFYVGIIFDSYIYS